MQIKLSRELNTCLIRQLLDLAGGQSDEHIYTYCNFSTKKYFEIIRQLVPCKPWAWCAYCVITHRKRTKVELNENAADLSTLGVHYLGKAFVGVQRPKRTVRLDENPNSRNDLLGNAT